jgi:hypothetical protein
MSRFPCPSPVKNFQCSYGLCPDPSSFLGILATPDMLQAGSAPISRHLDPKFASWSAILFSTISL